MRYGALVYCKNYLDFFFLNTYSNSMKRYIADKLAVLLAVCVVLSAFSVPLIDDTVRCHECEPSQNNKSNNQDTSCIDCLKIELNKNYSRAFRLSAAFIYPVDSLFRFTGIVLKNSEYNTLAITPVILKDRFNT